ncbi:hypothetical protein Tco_0925709 [Tanacetum coccineum]|uniref:Uncharacterized protein n=1 Tax=Tanacetum coccineum TaxID=301880 RepID=A0ABQ5D8V3_9ASTR
MPIWQDLKKGRVLWTSSEMVGLYLFDKEYNKSASVNQRPDKFSSRDVKFYETYFPYKMNQSNKSDVESETEVSNLNFFDFIESETISKTPNLSPNDDEEGTSGSKDGSKHQPDLGGDLDHSGHGEKIYQPNLDSVTHQPGYIELHSPTPAGEKNQSEGNFGTNIEVPVFQNVFENQTEEASQRRPVVTPLSENIVLAHEESDDDKFLMNITNYQNHTFKYLKLAPSNGIEFSESKTGFKVITFSDSDWAKYPMTRRATTSAKCESAIQIAAKPVMHEKAKHFDIDVHLVREKVASGLIKTEKVDLKSQVADILTKALGSTQHTLLTTKLRMINMFVSEV